MGYHKIYANADERRKAKSKAEARRRANQTEEQKLLRKKREGGVLI